VVVEEVLAMLQVVLVVEANMVVEEEERMVQMHNMARDLKAPVAVAVLQII
jgi:hypothetical protein